MINKTRIIRTKSTDPWWNLAVEEYLLGRVEPNQCILYLWQNENTVVIGRNQNPWRECKTKLLECEGGKLARRLSGGGAVYHDCGNLNFTFIAGKDVYDQDRQTGVILDAVRSFGIDAVKSGRNDLTVNGRKFSGNAFCVRKHGAYQHGTILVSTDFEKMTKYLSVSAEKMRSKGVQSVRSRVINLTELKPDLSINDMVEAVITSFKREYGSTADVEECIKDGAEGRQALEELYCKYSSWAWRYGEAPEFDVEFETRFDWGIVQIGFKLEGGKVKETTVYSDALDEEYISDLPGLFKGCEYNSQKMAQRLFDAAQGPNGPWDDPVRKAMTADLAKWLESKSF